MIFERGNPGSQFIAVSFNMLYNIRKRPGRSVGHPWELEIRQFASKEPKPGEPSTLKAREYFKTKAAAVHYAEVWEDSL